MENPLRKQIRSIMKDHKKRQMWYRIVTTLAVVVVFVTTYMLILPAITMENKAECGITEHKHDANCYSSHYEKEKELACTTDSLGVHKHTEACYDAEHKLICGYADFVIHEHDASCYDKDGNLVCTIPEHKLHQHTPECYQMQKQLVCTQEESVGHTHTPECYTKQQGALICSKEEHTHGEGCYDAEGNLICTLEEHTHSDECYEWTEVLTCTIPESAGHTHSEACYQDVQVLICEEPAELHTHTAECYKDGVLACGKLELKEHKHSETCFTEKQVLVETLICDRVEHVHTDECYKKSTEETATSEAVTASQNEETSSEDENSETASIEETSSEETSTEETSSEEASSEADTDAEETSTEASSEETSLEEASTEETSIEEASEDETEVESETESAEEAESESEVESESESEPEESSSIEAESEEESSEEETFDDIDNLMLDEEEQFVVMLTSSNAVKMDKTNTTMLALSGGDKDNKTEYDPNKHLYYTSVKLDFAFETKKMGTNSKYYFEYPEGIIIPEALLNSPKDLIDSKHQKAGTYSFEKDENGKYRVILDFDPDYVNKAGDAITGFVNFNGSIAENKGNEDGSITIKGSDGVDLTIPKDQITYPDNSTNKYDISVTKSGSYNSKDGKLVYKVNVTSLKGTPGDINFEDTITASGMTLGTPEIKVEKVTKLRHFNELDNPSSGYWDGSSEKANEIVNVTSSYDNGKISMTLPKLNGFENTDKTNNTKEYTMYEVTYTYDVSNITDKNPIANNTVNVSSKDNNTTEVKANDHEKVGITNEHTMSKNGSFDKVNNQILWTIIVNDNNMDIANSKLTDDMFASLKEGTDIKVDPNEGYTLVKEGDKVKGITFNAVKGGRNTNKYTITYYTAAEGTWDKETVVNNAKFEPGDGSGDIDKTGSVGVSDGSIAKSVGTATMLEDGKTIEIPWKVTLTIPKSGMKSGTIIKDDPTGGASHYMTYDQIVNWAKNIYWADENGNRLSNVNLDLTSLAQIQFKASDESTYDYSNILANKSTFESLTFTTWEIKLKYDLTLPENAKQLIFEYKTTADTSSAGIGTTSYKNNIQSSKDKIAYAQYDYKKGGVVKTDEGNQEGTTVKTNEDGTLTWKIKTTLGSETSKLTVTDTLPKGVKLVAIKGEDWINNLNNIQIAEDGTIYGIENNYYEVIGTYTNDIVTLKLGIKDNNSKLSKGATYTFVLTCKVDKNELQDYESGKQYTFTNHATASDDKGSIGSAEQTQEWTEEKKTQEIKVVDKSGSWDNNSRRVKYQIKLNPDGKDIVASSDVLTLTDEFKYKRYVHAQPENGDWNDGKFCEVSAWLLPDTVKLYRAIKQKDGTLKKDELITNWSWTVATSDFITDVYNSYSLSTMASNNIPDSTPLILEYEYQIQTDIPESWKSSSAIDISNSAKLEGTVYKDDKQQNDTNWEVQDSSAGVTTDRQYTIYKVSKGDYGKVLQGAEFKLQKYDENGDYTDTGKVYTTDEEGMITIKWQKEASDYQYEANTLYRLIEVEAPEGYTLPSPMQVEKNAVYFYFSSAKEGVENHLPETLPNRAWDLSKASQTSYIENEEENVKVDIQKKWMYTTEDGQDKYVAAWESQIEVALYRKESTKDPADETKETATLFMQPNSWDIPTNKGEYPLGTVINLTLQATGDQWNQGYLPNDIKWNELVATPVEEILGTSENKWLHTKKYRFEMTESENTLMGYGNENIISSLDFQIPVAPEDSLVGKYTLNATNNWRVSVPNLQRTGTNSNNETVYYTYYIKELTQKEGVTVTYNNNNGITSGTITVTNKKPEPKEYVLPETGGNGTYWYTMGGVLLIAGAAFLIYKKHMQKGGRRIW